MLPPAVMNMSSKHIANTKLLSAALIFLFEGTACTEYCKVLYCEDTAMFQKDTSGLRQRETMGRS